MNKSRVIISLLLVLITVLSMAGCGKKVETSATTTTEAMGTTTTVVNEDGSTTTTTTSPDGTITTTTTNPDGTTTTTTTSPSGETTTSAPNDAPVPETQPSTPDANLRYINGLAVVGTTAYELYYFNQSYADKYVNMINAQANNLAGIANVYVIVIPKNVAIGLSDELQAKVSGSNQKTALEYFYNGFNSNVKEVPIYNTMLAHRDEYLYFRTDHHWTALGAYYAYTEFTKVRGITTHPLSKYTELNFGNFLGTLYSSVNKANSTVGAQMKANPDVCYGYRPNPNATMYYGSDENNAKTKFPIVANGASYGTSGKYLAFIAGDQAFEEITNPDITDGSSIVVVKESFGNAFVPFLVENYHKVYVIDYRHYKKSISDFVKAYGVQDVLYINNISAATSSLVNSMKARQ